MIVHLIEAFYIILYFKLSSLYESSLRNTRAQTCFSCHNVPFEDVNLRPLRLYSATNASHHDAAVSTRALCGHRR